jgi:uncharacterized protein YqhQ
MGWPVLRGIATLGHAMTLGFRALRFSANVALEQAGSHPGLTRIARRRRISSKSRAGWLLLNIVLSVGFFIFMYKFVPLVAATELKRANSFFGGQIMFNLVDGAVRLDFVSALYLGRVPDAGYPSRLPVSRRRAQDGLRF